MKLSNISMLLVFGLVTSLLISTSVSANWSDAADKSSDAAKEVGHAVSESSSDAWESTKKTSSDAYDKTKEVSSDAWESTKGAVHDGADYVSEKTK